MEGNLFTINCSLDSHVIPTPEFQFYVTQTSNGVDELLSNYTMNVSVISQTAQSLSINGSFLLSESAIKIVCNVSNINGSDSATTYVNLCGKILFIHIWLISEGSTSRTVCV